MENTSVKSSTEKKPVRRGKSATATPSRTPLDRTGWVEAAISTLATEGLAGLRVEVLAKRCGVTKGSFYWHFRDRQDLLEAVLEHWREGRIRDIEKQTAAHPGKERERLYYLIDIYSTRRNQKGMAIELAVRDWAQRDAQAATTVRAVDVYRLECTERLFLACGLSPEAAQSRSLLLSAYVFGQSLMFYESTEARQRIAERIVAD